MLVVLEKTLRRKSFVTLVANTRGGIVVSFVLSFVVSPRDNTALILL